LGDIYLILRRYDRYYDQMASIHKDPRGKSPFWYCAYSLPDGRRVFRSTKQRERKKALAICLKLGDAAEAARTGELTEIAARKSLDDILESVGARPIRSETVRAFSATWLASKKLSVRVGTYSVYHRTIQKFLDSLGERADRSLASVTPADVASFRDARGRGDGVSAGTLVMDLTVLRSVFSSARRQGLLTHNPAEAVDLPVRRPIERVTFSSNELRALLASVSGEWKTLILLGYYLGGRLSDMASLSWEAVDLAGGVIFYTQGKTRRRVEVPIHPELEERLLEIAGDQQDGHLCPTLAKTRIDGRNGLSNRFARLLIEAGIPAETVNAGKNSFRRKSYHSLRHSFASALTNAGVSPELRMKLTGHRSLGAHQRYTHHELAPLKAAIAALPLLGR
jgi:integrase